MSRVVGKTKPRGPVQDQDPGLDRRDHKKRGLATLPNSGVVDMSRDDIQWHPLCLIQTGTKNVAMEATAENFTKLFEIVSRHMDEHAARQLAGVHTPTRKLRRRESNPQYPRGPPDARQLYIRSKRWVQKVMKDVPTPPSGSGSSYKCNTNRRFLNNTSVNLTGGSSGSRPNVYNRVSAEGSKRSRRVLSHDVAPEHDDDDTQSLVNNPFGDE